MLELNSKVDRAALAAKFRADGRVQVHDVLSRESAERVQAVLMRETAWELAWCAGNQGEAQVIPNHLIAGSAGAEHAGRARSATDEAARRGEYAFRYASYPMLTAYLEGRRPGGAHDLLLEALNSPEILGLAREVTGIPELLKADAQATMFAPNHFLGLHTDENNGQSWRIAYVLNFAPDDWNPNWGGYLQFFDDDGNISAGWRPRFNVLNLVAVPCPHSVSYVTPFAPAGRIAITGWFRDR